MANAIYEMIVGGLAAALLLTTLVICRPWRNVSKFSKPEIERLEKDFPARWDER
jgi:hypothetical protein